MSEHQNQAAMTTTATTCPYCGVGCGVLVQHDRQAPIAVSGDRAHPANFGRLCVKGSALHETLGEHGRVLHPRVDGVETRWDDAIDAVVTRLRATIERHGAESVAGYLSGQLLTEDYYVANKLFKGFIGTPHLDTNSRLCMASAVAGHKRAFGADAVPCCYEDLEQARLLVIVGSNLAWNHPVLFQRVSEAKRRDPALKVVVIDPRMTETCEIADLFLGLRAGGDIRLFNGLLAYLSREDGLNRDFIRTHTEGFEEALAEARRAPDTVAEIATACGLDPTAVETFYRWFAREPRVVTLFSQGTNQSDRGTDRVNAIINCHLAGGRIGYPGAGPFSITGQPNAMGGREVGGLANQLAAHMDYHTPGALERVTRFWATPALTPRLPSAPGHKAVALIEALERGEIQALWVMATNPAVSLPDSQRVRRALERCPLVIVSEAMESADTLAYADIVLPASSWAEKDGTVTNSERRISRQRGMPPPPGEARHDWQALCEVAAGLGYGDAFDYQAPWQIFDEHARLSGFENDDTHGRRLFDISALAGLDAAGYDALAPIQWPVNTGAPHGTSRLFEDARFATPNHRARLVPIVDEAATEEDRDFILNTGRIRDQWHTMTRTARSTRLNRHRAEPFVELHPDDAAALSIRQDALVRLDNPRGSFLGRARLTPGQRRGELFVPIHWNHHFTTAGLASALTERRCDPISGQPASKSARVRITTLPTRWEASVLLERMPQRNRLAALGIDYWTQTPLRRCVRLQLAASVAPAREALFETLFGGEPTLWSEPSDGIHFRAAWLEAGRLRGWLRVAPALFEFDDDWLDLRFADASLDLDARRRLLAGRSLDERPQGRIICSCHQVGQRPIQRALEEGCLDIETLGQRLRCGTQCGSCIPELKRMIGQANHTREADISDAG